MNTISKDELYQNLNGFLKTKGIVLTEGSYAQGIQKSCALLSEAINLGQKGFDRAKTGIDKKLDQMRQVIHEKTAPKPPMTAEAPPPPTPEGSTAAPPKVASPKRPHARKKAKAPRRSKSS